MMFCVPMVITWFIRLSACSVCYVVGRREWKGVCADFGIGGWRVRCGDVIYDFQISVSLLGGEGKEQWMHG